MIHRSLYNRWKDGHGSHCAVFDLFDAVGVDACIFEIVAELPKTTTKSDLLWRERWWIENNPCVNIYRPILTEDERVEQTRQINQNYRTIHRHARNEYGRQYRARKKAEKLTQTLASAPETTL